MAKVPYGKLNLKKVVKDPVTIKVNDIDIEVKQYLPIQDKTNLVTNVLAQAVLLNRDENGNIRGYKNPILEDILFSLEMIFAYTNISFTEKQKEDIGKLYDLLETNGVIVDVFSAIPEEEFKFIFKMVSESLEAYYTYKTSLIGVMESVVRDYAGLDLDAQKIQKELADPNNMELLKNVLTKLG